MIARDLIFKITRDSHPDDHVMAMDDTGRLWNIMDVTYEPVSDDGEGHATSTGATIWIKLEEH